MKKQKVNHFWESFASPDLMIFLKSFGRNNQNCCSCTALLKVLFRPVKRRYFWLFRSKIQGQAVQKVPGQPGHFRYQHKVAIVAKFMRQPFFLFVFFGPWEGHFLIKNICCKFFFILFYVKAIFDHEKMPRQTSIFSLSKKKGGGVGGC